MGRNNTFDGERERKKRGREKRGREEKGKNEKFARENEEGRGKKQRNKIDERMKIIKNSIYPETEDGLINEYDKGKKKR